MTSLKPSTGCGATVSRCLCKQDERATKEAIENGLKLIRLRFTLGVGELPWLPVISLDKYLLYLLGSGTKRTAVPFPRAQRGWNNDGFPSFVRLGRKSRWALAHSVASLKRSLPAPSCAAHPPPSSFDKWHKTATSCSNLSSPEYLAFARKIARRVFKFGWDFSYRSFCESNAPRASSRYEPRTTGSGEWSSFSNQADYLLATTRGVLPPFLRPDLPEDVGSVPVLDFRLRYKEIPSAGKCRPMGIPSVEYDILAPLHKAMYQYIAGKDWLMRGPPSSSRIKSTCLGNYNTSVDLTAATDNLPLDVTEAVLCVALAKARHIPGAVKVWACQSLRPSIFHKGWCRGIVSHGQMMGTYLSFPLLCLQSYIAAQWAGRHSQVRGILVNGDDTIISSDFPLGDYPEGFILNDRKTIRAKDTVELNSTTFLRNGRGKWEEVKHLRRGAALADYPGILHLASAAVKAGPAWMDALVKIKWGSRWRLTPLQMGLSLRVHSAWRRQTTVCNVHVPLPRPPPDIDDRFLTVFEEPCVASQLAFRQLIFNSGRRPLNGELEIKSRKRLWKLMYGVPRVPRPRKVRTTYRLGRRFNSHISYDPNWKPDPSLGRDRWFLSLEHEEFWEERRSEESSRLLATWATSLVEC